MKEEAWREELAAALRERLEVIGDREARERDAAAHLERLRAASEKIDTLWAVSPGRADAGLAHFIERRSYDKALAWLEEK